VCPSLWGKTRSYVGFHFLVSVFSFYCFGIGHLPCVCPVRVLRIGNAPGADTTTKPNQYVAELYSNGNNTVIGPGVVLKVMAGDQFSVRAESWYQLNGTTPGTPLNPLTDVVTALITGIAAAPGEGAVASALQANSAPLSPNVLQFLADTGANIIETKPHAFLNWVLFDNQFNFVSASSGFQQVGANGVLTPIILTNLPVTSSGYLYIYTSNATANVPVFFDNLQVTHTRGPLLEEDHYYPFGLSMSFISDKAIKTQYAENKYRFNGGNELQNREFTDGSGLEMYDATHRMYDPQVGRFSRIDDMAELSYPSSTYAFVLDNPISFYDPLGDTTTLPTVTVTAAKPGSLTYGLNHYNYAQTDAWVDFMLKKGHSSAQIDRWALSNDLLNADTRKWILDGTTDDSKRYRHRMASSWRAQGKVYKALLAAYAARLGVGGIQVFLADNPASITNAVDILDDVELDGKELKNGELHGEIEGDADEIEMNVARDATQTGKGQYKLPDGTDVKFYQSTKGGGQSMQVNTGDVIYKIRIK
jgi:RHS repeat-associated protein